MKIKKNIGLILSESYRWRNRNLIESAGFVEPKLSWKKNFKSNAPIFFFSVFLSLIIYDFINEDFAGYVISSLSIFVGLFTSVLILIFDKYLSMKKIYDETVNPSSNVTASQKKIRNFSMQFIFISLESLLIAVTLITLLLLPLLLKGRYLENVFSYFFVNFEDWTISNITTFFVNTLSCVSRIFIVLLLYKFLKYLFYIFGSLGAFLLGVFKNNIRL